jgi:uncharacterized membrane protein YeiB
VPVACPIRAPEAAPARPRVIGVDVARGLALFGMMAVHSFPTFGDDGGPTAATAIAGGRSAATFVLLAGVGLAFMSGSRTPAQGRERRAAVLSLVVRASLIGALGLLLDALEAGPHVILTYYAVFFLLAIPLLPLSPRRLVLVSTSLVVLGPVLLVTTARAGLDYSLDPVLVGLVGDPVVLLTQLLLTGTYPAVAYMAYLSAGIAIGRLDLRSPQVAQRLLVGGIALAVAAQLISWVTLHPLGGLTHLLASSSDPSGRIRAELLWAPEQGTSWWYLALPAPHANTPFDLAHTLGCAVALLGAVLLLTRSAALRALLWPVAAVGAMTLTLYSAHILLLWSDGLEDWSVALYLVMVVGSLLWAVLWRRRHAQGPLEQVVATLSGRARRAVLTPAAVPICAADRE